MIEKLLNDTTHSNLNQQKKEQADGNEANKQITNDNANEPFSAEIPSNNNL